MGLRQKQYAYYRDLLLELPKHKRLKTTARLHLATGHFFYVCVSPL